MEAASPSTYVDDSRAKHYIDVNLKLQEKLKRCAFASIVSLDLSKAVSFDFTSENKELVEVMKNGTEAFTAHLFAEMKAAGTEVGFGKYDEERMIYSGSDNFTDSGSGLRILHLGIDIFAKAGTCVFAPLDGIVHSFANNTAKFDYGPCIVLEHELEGLQFYTLYGHLSLDSIKDLKVGQHIGKGEKVGDMGDYPINGDWPPHVHFQVILDMFDKQGDFPGVYGKVLGVKNGWLALCPNPSPLIVNGKH